MADAAAGGGAAAAPAGSAEKRAEEVGGLEEVGQRTVRFVCCGASEYDGAGPSRTALTPRRRAHDSQGTCLRRATPRAARAG